MKFGKIVVVVLLIETIQSTNCNTAVLVKYSKNLLLFEFAPSEEVQK